MAPDDLLLLPRPRSLSLDERAEPAGPGERHVRVPDLPAEGFRLTAGPSGTTVEFADDAGRRHAGALAAQIRAQTGGELPQCRVEDWPEVAVRGFMLDVSRDRVPTRATLARLVEVLALARYNHLQLYIEHAFAHPGHEAVWADASPLDGDDLAWLDAECREQGIELAANQNTFGHMGRWLSHKTYAHRAECPDGFEPVAGLSMPPGVLAPTEANATFARSLVREQLAHLDTRTVNIGCDETFELGRGASRAEVAERGRGRVYLDHLERIAGPLLAEGLGVQFWGDMVAREPELVSELPAGDLTALAWGYEAPGTPAPQVGPGVRRVLDQLGVDLDADRSFGAIVEPYAERGQPFWVAAGTSAWNSLVGRIDNARENLLDAAVTGARTGAGGYLVTDWGDNGHLQPPSVSWGPAVYGGAVAWCAAANADLDLAAVLDCFVFEDPAGELGQVVETLGRLWGRTGQRAFNASPLQAALCPHQVMLTSGEADADQLEGVVSDIEDVLATLDAAGPRCPDGTTVTAELGTAARMARHGAWRLLADAGAPTPDIAELAADLEVLIADHATAWAARSRPGGFADSVAHLGAARERAQP